MTQLIKDRYFIIGTIFALVGLIIFGRILDLQVIHGKENELKALRKFNQEKKVTAPRGEILDRNFTPIATNRVSYAVWVVKLDQKTDEYNFMLKKLADIFEKNGDSYYNKFSRYLSINPIDWGSVAKDSEEVRNSFIQTNVLKKEDAQNINTAQDMYEYLRDKVYKISTSYSDEDIYKIMTLRYELTGCTRVAPVCIAKDVSKETVAEIEERNFEFPGVSINNDYSRRYINGKFIAHILGYVGSLTDEIYNKKKNEGYSLDDIIGITGAEASLESELRGKNGLRRIQDDLWGKQTADLGGIPAIPGKNVLLTIDMNLQKTAMESLERTINDIRQKDDPKNRHDASSGAVVVMDVNNGEILAMASYPTYDPSIFVSRPDDKEAQNAKAKLFTDPLAPALNRCIQGTYTPGSTFKPIVGIAGLEEGIITPYSTYNDPGYCIIGGMRFNCLEFRDKGIIHGDINLKKALETSCNVYFHKLGVDTKIENIDKWAKLFGLGEKTGLDIGGYLEAKGTRANPEFKQEVFKDIWRPADTAQASIGQLFNSFTPVQLANYVATIANGGKKFTPHLVKKIIDPNTGEVIEKEPNFEQLPVKPETIAAIKEGMVAVANSQDGTAVELFKDLKFMVAGKTGTAETGDKNASSNGLFISYAPADNPQIAVAVAIEHGVWGAYTAQVAKDIMLEYFNINNSKNNAPVNDNIFTFTK